MVDISFQPEFDNLILLGLWETASLQYSRMNMNFNSGYDQFVGHYLWTTWLNEEGTMSKRYVYLL